MTHTMGRGFRGAWRSPVGACGSRGSSVMGPTTRLGAMGFWRRGVSRRWLSRGGTVGWVVVTRLGVGRWGLSGAWGMVGGLCRWVMVGGGLLRRLIRRLSGCLGSTAWRGTWVTSWWSLWVRWLCII